MKQLKQSIPLILLTLVLSSTALSAPTVFPTGTTIYTPDKTWNGFTVLSILSSSDIIVIDMNGNVVKQWAGFNVSAGGPARILPGGIVVATSGAYPGHQESLELVQLDFEGSDI